MAEIWKSVIGWEEYYEVSSRGRLKRVCNGPNTFAGKILQCTKHNTGYFRVVLRGGGKFRRCLLHVLVAEAFLGPKPEGFEVNHKNANKRDNRIKNLEYVTRLENMRHAYRLKLRPPPQGEKNGRSILTERQVIRLRKLYANGTIRKSAILAKMFGITQDRVRSIVTRRSWKHI